jgi:uncharacterized membrane protein
MTSPAPGGAAQRWDFIDWYRGLACILMFQTHAYDAWLRASHRQGWFWELARMQLGGFPARMFLFLAGVSLMMRYSSQARRGVSEWEARKGGVKRGFEVLIYGLLFRLASFILAGASKKALPGLFKVDILNCIGVSLMLCSVIVGPMHLKFRRPPILAILLIPIIVMTTPLLQALPYPRWLPAPIGQYLWDVNPMGSFPLFPWLGYALAGCIAGGWWMRAAEEKRLGRVLLYSAIVGALMALAGQLVVVFGWYIFYPTPAVPIPAYPNSFVYRTGMCLVFGAVSYVYCLKVPPGRFSPLRLLGQTSMLVYIVHLELVYGFPSWPVWHRLSTVPATLLIVVLTAMMIALAYWRVEIHGKRKKQKPAPPVAAPT